MFASTWRACASTPPATIAPVAGSRPTWPASTSQSPARTAGEYGPAAGGALGVGTLLDRHRSSWPSGSRGKRRTGLGRARSTSRPRPRRTPRRSTGRARARDRRRSSPSIGGMSRRAQHAERADREVVDLAGLGVDREASLVTQPSAMCAAPIAYERSTISSSGSPAATDVDVDRRSTACPRPRSHPTARRACRAARRRTTVDVAVERARDEHRLLGEPDRAQIGAHRRTGERRPRVQRATHLDTVRRRPHAAARRAPRATTPSISTDAVAQRPRPPRSAGASGPRRTTSSRE